MSDSNREWGENTDEAIRRRRVLAGKEIGMYESHERKCWGCGNVAIHRSSITPWVLCSNCGSQDTRKIKQPIMESEDIEQALRDELKRHGQRWDGTCKRMNDANRVEMLGKLMIRRVVSEASEKRYAKDRPVDVPEYRGDPEIMATKGSLGHTTGGGKRNIRGTKSLS